MIKQLEEQLGKDRVKENENMFVHTTLRMNAQAQYFYIAKTREDLIAAKKASLELDLPLHILGGGSNVAILTKNIKGLVVKNFYMKKEVVSETPEQVELLVSSGYPITKIVNEAIEAGYKGFEYHLGLPGTIGGAIYMNSKWTNPLDYFGQKLKYAYLLDNKGEVKKVGNDYFKFGYDQSILQETGEILLDAVFPLEKADSASLRKTAQEAFEYRRKTQPHGVASSGCIFRNIDSQSAGELIDKAGLKGFRVGKFFISPHHANFVIHEGGGDPSDLSKLIQTTKDKVKEKFGFDLKEEVVVIY